MTATFEVGARYWAQSAGDSNCIWWFTVTARTAQFVTLFQEGSQSVRHPEGETFRVKVHAIDAGVIRSDEWAMPFGTYSMAPVIRASRNADDLPPSLRPERVV